MQIVIDIAEGTYQRLIEQEQLYIADLNECIMAVPNGTPLPKGHGRLIDADKLKKTKHDIYIPEINYRHRCVHVENIDEAPTILEADKKEEEVTE